MKSGGKITGIAWCLHEDISRFVYLCRPYFIVAAPNYLVIFIIHYYNTDYLFSKGEERRGAYNNGGGWGEREKACERGWAAVDITQNVSTSGSRPMAMWLVWAGYPTLKHFGQYQLQPSHVHTPSPFFFNHHHCRRLPPLSPLIRVHSLYSSNVF